MPLSPAPDQCLMFLVRHAATNNNVARPPRIQGRGQDEGLSPEGRHQAGRTAQFLADQPINAAFTSPLARAAETARIIAEPHGLIPQPIAALVEVDVGRWEGRSWDEIERTEPEAYRQFVADPASHGYAGGENLNQVRTRVVPALRNLMQSMTGSLILVVGHNVVNRVLLADLLHVPLARARTIDQDNCGVNIVRCSAGQLKALTVNATFHLQ